mmetsp:Transcript_1760/g.2015  ORF Transcript_1760/g.2015 Transcript_1760/m.2015 type:complete len:271 (-) Transcript_1760:1232-2044(-)
MISGLKVFRGHPHYKDRIFLKALTLFETNFALAQPSGGKNFRGHRKLNSKTPISVPELATTPKSPEGAQTLYDKWAETYDETLKSWKYPAPKRVAAVMNTLLLNASKSPFQDPRVLDLGCGTGMSGEALKSEGIAGERIGFDISKRSLEIASSKNLYEQTVQGNLELELPFQNEFFSGIISVGVLSYVHRFDILFPEVCRTMKARGIFIFTHRTELWDDNIDECATEASKLESIGSWKRIHLGTPEPYMPENPDNDESDKTIRIIAFQKL